MGNKLERAALCHPASPSFDLPSLLFALPRRLSLPSSLTAQAAPAL